MVKEKIIENFVMPFLVAGRWASLTIHGHIFDIHIFHQGMAVLLYLKKDP